MATTFVKNGTNVLVTIGSNDPISVPGGAFISPHPSEADAILISEKFNPQNIHESLKIFVSEVSLPVATDRKDLIEQLSTNFFFRVGASGVGFKTVTITGNNVDTDYTMPDDTNIFGDFSINSDVYEASLVTVSGVKKIRFTVALTSEQVPTVTYTPITSTSPLSIPTISVKGKGAIGNGVVDDTDAIQAVLNSYKNVYFPSGTYLVSTLNIPEGVHIFTDGFLTIFKQKSGTATDTRILNVVGSNVTIEDCKIQGNISTDTGEQMHGIFCYANAVNGNIDNIKIGNIIGENLRGDVLYLGNANSGEKITNVVAGSIFGANIYRNVVSITGGADIYVHSITGSAVGLIMFDIESNIGGGIIQNITINYCKGHSANIACPTSTDFATGIKINHLDINPEHCAYSTPAMPRGSYANDGLLLRNIKSILIDYAKISGFNRMGINIIKNGGDMGVLSLVFNYLEMSDCSKTDTTYYAYFLGVNEPVIRYLKVDATRNNIRVFDGLTGGTFGSVEYTFSEDIALFRNCSNVDITNLNANGTLGAVLVSCTNVNILNGTVVAQTLASYSHKCSFINVTATVTTIFTSNYTDHFVKNSTLNTVYYCEGFYERVYTMPLKFGAYSLWVDSGGLLRIKNGAPASETDGTIVGTQS